MNTEFDYVLKSGRRVSIFAEMDGYKFLGAIVTDLNGADIPWQDLPMYDQDGIATRVTDEWRQKMDRIEDKIRNEVWFGEHREEEK